MPPQLGPPWLSSLNASVWGFCQPPCFATPRFPSEGNGVVLAWLFASSPGSGGLGCARKHQAPNLFEAPSGSKAARLLSPASPPQKAHVRIVQERTHMPAGWAHSAWPQLAHGCFEACGSAHLKQGVNCFVQ